MLPSRQLVLVPVAPWAPISFHPNRTCRLRILAAEAEDCPYPNEPLVPQLPSFQSTNAPRRDSNTCHCVSWNSSKCHQRTLRSPLPPSRPRMDLELPEV